MKLKLNAVSAIFAAGLVSSIASAHDANNCSLVYGAFPVTSGNLDVAGENSFRINGVLFRGYTLQSDLSPTFGHILVRVYRANPGAQDTPVATFSCQ